MSLKEHAVMEFKAAGWLNEDGSFKDDMQQLMCEQVLELLELFSNHGHSGFSAPYAIDLFSKLAKYEPLVPLTGEEWEWFDHGYCKQNIRCGHVFIHPDRFDGQAYDLDGKVFYDILVMADGEEVKSHFTSGDSWTPITFPYTPKREYIWSGVKKPYFE